METPPIHVLLALDAQILGGRDAEISTESTPTVTDSAGDGPGSTTSTTEGRPDVQRRRKTNPVVDGQLVPRERKTSKKRRRDEAAATPSTRPRLD
jgi:hypothetical protein